MSQRDSGYARKTADFYETPSWVTLSLIPHLPRKPKVTWECACGNGAMVDALRNAGVGLVVATDLSGGINFLHTEIDMGADAIITNPPYKIATEFIHHAIKLMKPSGGQVAMLLRTDFDHAKSRAILFRDNPAFAKKVVLTKRIVWFEPEPGEKGKSPSFNHAWFIWDWQHEGRPSIAYGP